MQLEEHQYTGFDWDAGNRDKNWLKHDVYANECEEIFFNEPCIVGHDHKHALAEPRFYALGQTDEGRRLFVVFTIRKTLIRIISARDMSKKEQNYYEKAEKSTEV